jgi:hypothetical protein
MNPVLVNTMRAIEVSIVSNIAPEQIANKPTCTAGMDPLQSPANPSTCALEHSSTIDFLQQYSSAAFFSSIWSTAQRLTFLLVHLAVLSSRLRSWL